MALTIRNLTRQPLPRGSRVFSRAAREILRGWDISLVFVGAAKARALNKLLRKKNYVPNVLSYALDGKNGEIIICPAEAKKQAADFGLTERDYILYLFIHGALHIKGWKHGAKMEQCERTLLARYGSTHSNRH